MQIPHFLPLFKNVLSQLIMIERECLTNLVSDLDTEEDLLFVLPEAGHVAGVELQLVLQQLGIPHSSLTYDSLI